MNTQMLILCGLTFVIHLVGTLAYAVRIAGVRTRRLAVSFALFNVLILASRTSNTFQGPFLAKRVEHSLSDAGSGVATILGDMRWLLVSASLATLVGGLFIPTFQRIFGRAVRHFHTHRSLPRLFWDALTRGGFSYLRASTHIPSSRNIRQLATGTGLSTGVIGLNVLAIALWTVGVFASLYAGILRPELRVTCSSLSSIINGVATILLFVVIDPQLSVMTDDVIEGRVSDGRFRRAITALVGARLIGTIAAQFLLVPSAMLITHVAELI
jgi:hypothetical protein